MIKASLGFRKKVITFSIISFGIYHSFSVGSIIDSGNPELFYLEDSAEPYEWIGTLSSDRVDLIRLKSKTETVKWNNGGLCVPFQEIPQSGASLLLSFSARALPVDDGPVYGFLQVEIKGTGEEVIPLDDDLERWHAYRIGGDWNDYRTVLKVPLSQEAEGLRLIYDQEFQELKIANLKCEILPVSEDRERLNLSPYYEGIEEGAPWRGEANERIEAIRKGDVVIRVVDGEGNPVKGAQVEIYQQKHDFGFGTATSTYRVVGERNEDTEYRRQLRMNFNQASPSNALK